MKSITSLRRKSPIQFIGFTSDYLYDKIAFLDVDNFHDTHATFLIRDYTEIDQDIYTVRKIHQDCILYARYTHAWDHNERNPVFLSKKPLVKNALCSKDNDVYNYAFLIGHVL